LPTAAAMPNQTPRTFRRPPLERGAVVALALGLAARGLVGEAAVVVDASVVLDNGVSGVFVATPP